jgi:hypothetical protein
MVITVTNATMIVIVGGICGRLAVKWLEWIDRANNTVE